MLASSCALFPQIDLDDIEMSNLNRQFLFRKRHVGQPKAKARSSTHPNELRMLADFHHLHTQVAAESVMRFGDGSTEIIPHHGSVTSREFDSTFFRKFDVVLNGLDNLEARFNVNRKCLAAGVPLVDSGSNGLSGQVTVHIGGRTACYECEPKPTQKSYPICTIRNTPDKPIHCIVWAKDLLFEQLFGESDTTDLAETDEQPISKGNSDGDAAESTTNAFTRGENESMQQFSERIYRKVFVDDVQCVRKMEELWTERSPPQAVELEENAASNAATADSDGSKSARARFGLRDLHAIWNKEENQKVFLVSLQRLLEREGTQYFDKDDEDAVCFVVSAANLRATNYSIEKKSLFDAKGMAGNIVHAVSTTNCIAAGLMVLEATKIVNRGKNAEDVRFAFIDGTNRAQDRAGMGKRLSLMIPSGTMSGPNPQCYACQRARLTLMLDTSRVTLNQMIETALRKKLGVSSPIVNVGSAAVYEEGDDLDEEEQEQYRKNLECALKDLPGGGVTKGTTLTVQDLLQEFACEVVVEHTERISREENPEEMELKGAEAAQEQVQSAGKKRKRREEEEAQVIEAEASKAASREEEAKWVELD